jgi:hypothetical protein
MRLAKHSPSLVWQRFSMAMELSTNLPPRNVRPAENPGGADVR